MGGCCCCCSSKGVELNSSPPFYHYPRVSEEHEPLSSHRSASSTLSTGLLIDSNLETSVPDSYRPPPAPMPYDANLRCLRSPPGDLENCGNKSDTEQTLNTESVGQKNTSDKNLNESDCKGKTDIELSLSKELAVELEKSGELKKCVEALVSAEEEDVCPTCLEEYDAENPKIITKCEHYFHLSCILEWMERSDTCPICDQEMIFNSTIDS